jgi:hypothetical protein
MVRRANPFSALFKPEPLQWGLRGDPFLWRAMARALSSRPFPNTGNQLDALIEAEFERLVGSPLPEEKSISDSDSIYVKRYARGGMSSGQVSPHFWRVTALPLLRSRFMTSKEAMRPIGLGSDGDFHFYYQGYPRPRDGSRRRSPTGK